MMKDHVVDAVMREHDLHSRFGNAIAEDVVVGAVVSHEAEAVQRLHTLTPNDHRWTKSELHSFEHVGNNHARGHFDRIAERFKISPESTRGQAAKDAGRHSY